MCSLRPTRFGALTPITTANRWRNSVDVGGVHSTRHTRRKNISRRGSSKGPRLTEAPPAPTSHRQHSCLAREKGVYGALSRLQSSSLAAMFGFSFSVALTCRSGATAVLAIAVFASTPRRAAASSQQFYCRATVHVYVCRYEADCRHNAPPRQGRAVCARLRRRVDWTAARQSAPAAGDDTRNLPPYQALPPTCRCITRSDESPLGSSKSLATTPLANTSERPSAS